ncbi:MAG: hypothetical protein ACFE75_06825 [Candidatus Hodarchaeota archaeon]
MENEIRTFKLNFDGTFDEIAYENIKEVFTIVNILAIYIQKIKTMYIWIGRNATQALKNHITQIRVLLKEEFPQFRIIRNITFDMRSEPFEFFKNLDISKDELYEIIDYQEKTVLPILEKIDELKKSSENLIKSEDYKSAIEILKEIIKLAEKIQDDALVSEQKRLISELSEKFEEKQIISEIEEETTIVKKKYNELIKSKKILEAHSLVESFIKKYETVYDLSLIPSAKVLILREKKKWIAEQNKLKDALSKLEEQFSVSLKTMEIINLSSLLEKGRTLLSELVDEEIKKKWKNFGVNFLAAKDLLESIEILSKNGIDALNDGSCSESLEFFEQIIYQLQEYNKREK